MSNDVNFKPGPRAEVIEDSVSPDGVRLTTIEATFHRFILAEVNTHRLFSRNSASSRAIPFPKQVNRLLQHPAVPVAWATEQRGMQGGEPLKDDDAMDAEEEWLAARSSAIQHAHRLAAIGVHKSIVNRLLEPFMWHTAIITATEWPGFRAQRVSPLAQPEFMAVAQAMKAVYDASEPRDVDYGQWHLPYIDAEDVEAAWDEADALGEDPTELLKKVSSARCARVSYLTHDGRRDLSEDLGLYERLVSADPMHASPFEHVATPVYPEVWDSLPGNFQGWRQFRHDIQGVNLRWQVSNPYIKEYV